MKLKYFTKQVNKKSKKLGLHSWKINVVLEDPNDPLYSNARAYFNNTGKNASIVISKRALKKFCKKDLKILARHECLEIMLSDIRLALQETYSDNYIDRLIHNIIRVLEKEK